MKILTMADLHGHLPDIGFQLDDIDVIVIPGDIAPAFSPYYQTEWLNNEFREWATKLNKPVLGCYGNHDYGFFKNNSMIQIYANEIVDKFFLFSWTKEFMGWNYMVKDLDSDPAANRLEGSIESRLSNKLLGNLGKTPEIWICHGPPRGICDNNLGSVALYEAIETYQPKAVFVGHIHDGCRSGQIGTSHIYNCSLVDNALNLIYKPTIVELRTGHSLRRSAYA